MQWGIIGISQLKEFCSQMADQGMTSTYGLGHHFNEQLMIEMANGGRGQEDTMEKQQKIY